MKEKEKRNSIQFVFVYKSAIFFFLPQQQSIQRKIHNTNSVRIRLSLFLFSLLLFFFYKNISVHDICNNHNLYMNLFPFFNFFLFFNLIKIELIRTRYRVN